MKLKITSLFLATILLSSVTFVGITNAIAESRVVPIKNMKTIERGGDHRLQSKVDDRYGERTMDGIPCPCIFDKARNLKPKGGLYKGRNYVWGCKVFDQNGLCREVERVSERVKSE